jgi:hypothetical protein
MRKRSLIAEKGEKKMKNKNNYIIYFLDYIKVRLFQGGAKS